MSTTATRFDDCPTGFDVGDARWYDPSTERWLTEDPIFPESGPNPYEYCDNDPVNEVDPSGLAPIVRNFADDAPQQAGQGPILANFADSATVPASPPSGGAPGLLPPNITARPLPPPPPALLPQNPAARPLPPPPGQIVTPQTPHRSWIFLPGPYTNTPPETPSTEVGPSLSNLSPEDQARWNQLQSQYNALSTQYFNLARPNFDYNSLAAQQNALLQQMGDIQARQRQLFNPNSP